MSAEILSFETGRPAELAEDEPSLVVDVEGYEGPLDLLLALARQQKVDLAKISILALADQYLVFIEAARNLACCCPSPRPPRVRRRRKWRPRLPTGCAGSRRSARHRTG
jgi:hypothetical protein